MSSNSDQLLNSIIGNNVCLCEEILSAGFDINKPIELGANLSRETPLYIACMYRRPKIIEVLLQFGADVNQKDSVGRTPIHLTVDYTWHLVYAHQDEINIKFRNRDITFSRYVEEIQDSSLLCLNHLCHFGADVNLQIADNLQTPLHLAAAQNFVSCVNVMISYGANIEIKDSDGRTPLLVASRNGNLSFMVELMKLNADVSVTDIQGTSALHMMCSRKMSEHLSMLLYLLNKNLKLNIQNSDGNTPLHIAASASNDPAIDLLLNLGANPDLLNNDRESALYLFLDNVHPIDINFSTIQNLVNESIQIYITDAYGILPLDLYRSDMAPLRDALLKAAAQPSSLQRICRQIIRRTIGNRNLSSWTFEKMNYPTQLKDYILGYGATIHLDPFEQLLHAMANRI